MARWRKHFSQLLNVREVSDVRQRKIHTAEPLVPEPSAFEVEMTLKKICSERGSECSRTSYKIGPLTFRRRNFLVNFSTSCI